MRGNAFVVGASRSLVVSSELSGMPLRGRLRQRTTSTVVSTVVQSKYRKVSSELSGMPLRGRLRQRTTSTP